MNRLIPFVGGGLAALLVASALAQEPPTSPADAPAATDVPMATHASRGAACAHCHDDPHSEKAGQPGRFVDCGACHFTDHFAPADFGLDRHAATAFPLEGLHQVVPCARCHAEQQLIGLPQECAGCHIDRHRGILGERCEECHAVTGFTPVPDFAHARTGFTLEGAHSPLACTSCHRGENGQKLRQGAGPACATCHEASHGDIGEACATCHPVAGGPFLAARGADVFDHRVTGFPLERRHTAQKCGSCHTKGKPTPDARCGSCHETPHMGQLGFQCQDCHAPDRWTLARFDHDLTGFTLRGAHFTASCASCHTSQRWVGLTTECWDCHALDAARAPGNVDAHRFGRSDCRDCHTTWRWSL